VPFWALFIFKEITEMRDRALRWSLTNGERFGSNDFSDTTPEQMGGMIREAAASKDPASAIRAVDIAARVGGPGSQDVIGAAAENGHEAVRLAAVDALGYLAAATENDETRTFARNQLAGLSTDPSPSVAIVADDHLALVSAA
jgi:hypothetical protein